MWTGWVSAGDRGKEGKIYVPGNVGVWTLTRQRQCQRCPQGQGCSCDRRGLLRMRARRAGTERAGTLRRQQRGCPGAPVGAWLCARTESGAAARAQANAPRPVGCGGRWAGAREAVGTAGSPEPAVLSLEPAAFSTAAYPLHWGKLSSERPSDPPYATQTAKAVRGPTALTWRCVLAAERSGECASRGQTAGPSEPFLRGPRREASQTTGSLPARLKLHSALAFRFNTASTQKPSGTRAGSGTSPLTGSSPSPSRGGGVEA